MGCRSALLFLAALFCLASSGSSYRILAFLPFPSNSHQNAFFPLILELARRGHQVVYYTNIATSASDPNLDVRLGPHLKNEYLAALDLEDLAKRSPMGFTHRMYSVTEDFAREFFGNPVAQEIIHSSDTFDAVIMESMFFQEPVSALIHKFGCVGIEISSLGDSFWINELGGLPNNPTFQIDFRTVLSDDMTFMEKLYNAFSTASMLAVSYYHMPRMEAVMNEYFNYSGWEGRPGILQLAGNRSLVLANTDPVLSYPYPTPPHLKPIAGMNFMPNKPLPKDWQKIMDDSKDGVIYFSFGSNLNTSALIRGEVREAFLEVFRNIPQKVLIKWESENPANLPSNVKTLKWFPQTDILAHKNCRLFITHGGFFSLTETVYYGVPIIGVPFFSDQSKNVLHAVKTGYGLMLRYENITTQSVSWAIKEALTNPRYKAEAKRRSLMFRDRRHTGLEEAVYWTEYAIKYPNSLTPRVAFMSFFEKRMFELEVLFFIILALVYVGISILIRTSRKNTKKEKVKTS